MKTFNLDRINTYRKELMGISAIGILVVHAMGICTMAWLLLWELFLRQL